MVETTQARGAAKPPAPKKVATKPAKPVQRAQDVDDDHYHDNEDYYGYGNMNNDGRDDDDDAMTRKATGRDRAARNTAPDASRPAVAGAEAGARRINTVRLAVCPLRTTSKLASAVDSFQSTVASGTSSLNVRD